MANLSRRSFLGACAAPLLAQQRGLARRPNIVIILADDQGWGDLSINGNSNLSTPKVDTLARDGALLERFFVCPVCAPTRAEYLTGRYHSRGGVRGVSTGAERLNLDEKTIADTFHASGYATGAFGKWHNGSQFPYHPNARGFQEYYGFTSGHWGEYFNPELDHNGTLTRGKGYIADDLTNHAMDFMAEHRAEPFFTYLAFNTPHSPMQVPDTFYEKFANRELKMRARDPKLEQVPFTRAALAMCENIDWNVGRMLAKIDELKLANDTIVIYFSDNGPNSWRWNGGMKGRKGSVDEGGVRAPFMIRWPGKIQAGKRIPQIAGAIDLLPTLADMAGIPVVSTKPLDGVSLKPLLVGGAAATAWPDRMIFSVQNRKTSVRTQQYRFDDDGTLYDMLADPMQDRDIAAEKPEVAARLRDALKKWSQEALPKGKDDRPFTAGYSKTTMLPARDGVPVGGVERSNTAPNCSYFTNWTAKDDAMTWDIEIGRAGEYEAVVYYTCSPKDVGSTLELSFNGEKATAKIATPWESALRGKDVDRVPRETESYVKDFKPLSLGKMRLDKARGLLRLRALEVAGKAVADVRYVALVYQG
jgi:arylsulfatase A-like enzyme